MTDVVMYLFPPDQAEMIAAGSKRQTIRRVTRRNAKVGDRLQLYEGTRHSRKTKIVADPVCLSATPVEMDILPSGAVAGAVVDGAPATHAQIIDLAALGGFGAGESGEAAMGRFYLAHHGPGLFLGVIIRW